MFTIQRFFELGMKKIISNLIEPKEPALHLGPGKYPVDGAHLLEWPSWDADTGAIPYPNEKFLTIHAYHFLEHIQFPITILNECQRVLQPGGTMNIVVPYYNSNLAGADLDHKHKFNENTWRVLFDAEYYDKTDIYWNFQVNVNFIMGIEERCLALFTQLVKV